MSRPEEVRPDRYARRRRLPRWLTVVLVLLVVLLLAVLAAFGLLLWAFSGGWDGLRGSAQPGDRAVVSARRDARGTLDGLTAQALRSVSAGSGSGGELARVRFDQCEHGQNNWKIHDGYTLRCELSDSVVLSPASPDVTAVAAQVDAALRAGGWQPLGITDEMTQDAEPDHSFLRQTRTGEYQRAAGQELTVGVSVRSPSPVTGDLPYDPEVKVEGDVEAYRSAAQAAAPRVVVRTTVRYFEDD